MRSKELQTTCRDERQMCKTGPEHDRLESPRMPNTVQPPCLLCAVCAQTQDLPQPQAHSGEQNLLRLSLDSVEIDMETHFILPWCVWGAYPPTF